VGVRMCATKWRYRELSNVECRRGRKIKELRNTRRRDGREKYAVGVWGNGRMSSSFRVGLWNGFQNRSTEKLSNSATRIKAPSSCWKFKERAVLRQSLSAN
jgi:hypothetical protein